MRALRYRGVQRTGSGMEEGCLGEVLEKTGKGTGRERTLLHTHRNPFSYRKLYS